MQNGIRCSAMQTQPSEATMSTQIPSNDDVPEIKHRKVGDCDVFWEDGNVEARIEVEEMPNDFTVDNE